MPSAASLAATAPPRTDIFIDPAARQARIAAARQRAEEAKDEVRFAIDRLLDGLDAYGIGPDADPARVTDLNGLPS